MNKIEKQKHFIVFMIVLYCRHRLHCHFPPAAYRRLALYAQHRLDHCPWGDKKPACKLCPHHCYAPIQRKKIRIIMRWAAPRMFFYAPIEAFKHFLGK